MSDVMLLGHLPMTGELVARLVAGDGRKPITAFVPGTVVCLEQCEVGHWAITGWCAQSSHRSRTESD